MYSSWLDTIRQKREKLRTSSRNIYGRHPYWVSFRCPFQPRWCGWCGSLLGAARNNATAYQQYLWLPHYGAKCSLATSAFASNVNLEPTCSSCVANFYNAGCSYWARPNPLSRRPICIWEGPEMKYYRKFLRLWTMCNWSRNMGSKK